MTPKLEVNSRGDLCWIDSSYSPYREGDKPAIIYADGTIEYYKYGRLHRDGNKPAAILNSGDKMYYTNGLLSHIELAIA